MRHKRIPTTPVESYIEAPGPNGPLKGTMLAPRSGPAPMALIIPGSGPTDRDGNSILGCRAATYELLAEALAALGVGSVRIDKRGMFASAAAIPDADAVTIEDYADDVEAWVGAIRAETGVSGVWLIGHSEGGLVALAAAQKARDIRGVVLVAAAGRPLGEVLREQLQANPLNGPLLAEAFSAIDALEAGKRVDAATLNPMLVPLFRPRVQDYLINVFAHDPAELIAKLSAPTLILQGERDIQIGVADAERLKRAAPGAELVLLPDTNHVLKTVTSDDRRTNAATYADPGLPLAPGVAETIAGFINEATRPPLKTPRSISEERWTYRGERWSH